MLLAVPFVYEAAIANAEIQLATAGVVPDPEACSGSGYLAKAWHNAWQAVSQTIRGLIARGNRQAADDHSCWALIEFCRGSGELWDAHKGAEGRSGWAVDAIESVLAPAPLHDVSEDDRICQILSAPRLLRLARLMFADFDDVTLDASGGERTLDERASFGEVGAQLTINEIKLAHLLNLGSLLALDVRRMPSLLAEHIGVDEVLSAEWIRDQLRQAVWQDRDPDGAGMSRTGGGLT